MLDRLMWQLPPGGGKLTSYLRSPSWRFGRRDTELFTLYSRTGRRRWGKLVQVVGGRGKQNGLLVGWLLMIACTVSSRTGVKLFEMPRKRATARTAHVSDARHDLQAGPPCTQCPLISTWSLLTLTLSTSPLDSPTNNTVPVHTFFSSSS